MRRRAWTVVAIAAVVAGCGGAGEAQRSVEGDTLVVALPSQPENLNPIASDSVYEGNQPFFNGLLRYAKDLTPQPDLAAAMPKRSADGLRVMVRLRDGVRFHDGKPLTAEDVAFTYNAILDKDSASPLATLLDSLREARATARLTVEFRLKRDRPGVLRQAPGRDRPGAPARGRGHQDGRVQPRAGRHWAVCDQGVPARWADRDGGQSRLLPRCARDQTHRADRGAGRERARRAAREGHHRRRRDRAQARRPRAPQRQLQRARDPNRRRADAGAPHARSDPARPGGPPRAVVRRRSRATRHGRAGRRGRAGLRTDHEGPLGVQPGRRDSL